MLESHTQCVRSDIFKIVLIKNIFSNAYALFNFVFINIYKHSNFLRQEFMFSEINYHFIMQMYTYIDNNNSFKKIILKY